MKITKGTTDGCWKYVRYCMLVWTQVCVILGLMQLMAGITVLFDSSLFSDQIARSDVYSVGFSAIFVGLVFVAISILGFLAFLWTNRILLFLYGCIITIFFSVQFIIAIIGFSSSIRIKRELYEEYDKKVQLRQLDEEQGERQCCGSRGPSDYAESILPNSCCSDNFDSCTKKLAHKIGCAQMTIDAMYSNLVIAYYIFSLLSQILCIIAAFFLFSHMQTSLRTDEIFRH